MSLFSPFEPGPIGGLPKLPGSQDVMNLTDENYEMENIFVMRLPPEQAEKLHQRLVLAPETVKDYLSIKFDQTDVVLRHATVRLDTQRLSARMYDLPCIIEVLKTLDRKNFFKVQDVCQMLLVSNEPASSSTIESRRQKDTDQQVPTNANPRNKDSVYNYRDVETEEYEHTDEATALAKQKKKDREFAWPHGLTPPLKNVRRKRFRKPKRKKYMDPSDLEKQLKRLLREDMQAANVRWELVTTGPSGQELNPAAPSEGFPQNANLIPSIDEPSRDATDSNTQAATVPDDQKDFNIDTALPSFPIPCISPSKLKESDVFGELSSSSGEDND